MSTVTIQQLEARVARLENLQQDPAAYRGQSEREQLLERIQELRTEKDKYLGRIAAMEQQAGYFHATKRNMDETLAIITRERDALVQAARRAQEAQEDAAQAAAQQEGESPFDPKKVRTIRDASGKRRGYVLRGYRMRVLRPKKVNKKAKRK